MTVSFIIPVYNASITIFRCLDSIYSLPLRQEDFEVIVIDDCSTDNSYEILDEYKKNHANLILFRQQQNHRQGAARNIGVNKATGEYVVFVDSDDKVCIGLLDALKKAKENNLDMVAMKVVRVSSEGKIENEIVLPFHPEKVFTGVDLQTEQPFWFTGPVAYLYRRSFLKDVNYRFAEDVLFEDSDFVNVHLFHAQRMAYCNVCGYEMYYNALSTTHTFTYKHVSDYALLGTRMLSFYESLPDKTTKYADSILEGGSYNIMKSFKRLFRLGSISEVRSFYERFDEHFDRKQLLRYRKPAYCWTHWTSFCLKHREAASFITGCIGVIYKGFLK